MKKLLANLVETFRAPWLWLVLAGGLAVGCQTYDEKIPFSAPPDEFGGVTDAAAGSLAATDAARIAKGDMIRVTFSGVSILIPPHEEQVKDDGTITMHLIGSVHAEGKTTGELQREIQEKYVPDYYKRLNVTVTTDRQVYYVQGQVRSPNRQAYIGPTTVLKAVASAGDFTDFADRKRVELTRADGTLIKVDCVKAAKDASYDLPVYPGDKINVPMRRPFSGWF